MLYNTMLVHSIKDSSNTVLLDFLKQNFSKISESTVIKNYHPDFSNEPGNFFNVLKNGRFKEGNYFVLEDNGVYCGSSGWNPYPYADDVALLLTRSYIPKEYRTKYFLSKFFLPKMFEEANEYKKLWITCNEYNMAIYHAIERLNKGKPAGLFNSWPKIYSKFKPVGKKTIYSVDQYVAEFVNPC